MDNNQLKKYIENHIRNHSFKTKDELYKYLLELKKQQNNYALTEQDFEEFFKLFDALHMTNEIPLDMENYTNKPLNGQNYIVSEQAHRVLKTEANSHDFINEFKTTQNQIYAHGQDGEANAEEVFNKMADTQKEETTLVALHEAVAQDKIEQELLHKIRFFITKMKENPHVYKINIQNGIFYNIETHEIYEVRKNENTNQYEIFVGGEVRYDNTNNIENNQETIKNEHDEEKLEDLNKENVKVRRLVPQHNLNNAAFTRIGFLILNVISFTIVAISIVAILLTR